MASDAAILVAVEWLFGDRERHVTIPIPVASGPSAGHLEGPVTGPVAQRGIAESVGKSGVDLAVEVGLLAQLPHDTLALTWRGLRVMADASTRSPELRAMVLRLMGDVATRTFEGCSPEDIPAIMFELADIASGMARRN